MLPLFLLGDSAAHAQTRYYQATYLTASQFLAEVKEVSLDLLTDSSLTRAIPLTEQKNAIAKALAVSGITVRPNSPGTLEARVQHTSDAIQSVNDNTNEVDHTTVVHGIFIGVKFIVSAKAARPFWHC